MHTFFQGWRSKAGVVLLVMAAFSMFCWLRSRVSYEWMGIATGNQAYGLLAMNDSMTLMTYPFAGHSGWVSYESSDADILESELDWMRTEPDDKLLTIPFWSMTLPPALLSAYLLLWPSRRTKPTPPSPI